MKKYINIFFALMASALLLIACEKENTGVDNTNYGPIKVTKVFQHNVKAIKELEDSLANMETAMEIEIDSTLMAEGMTEFIDIIDSEGSSESYVSALDGYGQAKSAGSRTLGLITVILMLLGNDRYAARREFDICQ